MASYTNIEFDIFSFKWYCKDLLDQALLESISDIVNNTKFWDHAHGGYHYKQYEDINSTEYTVGTINAKAFIQEYGSGKYIKTSNPDFQEYRNGKYWNPARKSNYIVGRPAGTYTLPNWKTGLFEEEYKSKGRMEGKIIPFAKGQRSDPQTGLILNKIYTSFLLKVDNEVIPDLQKAIDTGMFMNFKTEKC